MKENTTSHHKHLTIFEIEKILFLVAKGYSITQIANELNRNKSTISRELRRNSVLGEYLPIQAQTKYLKRRKNCCPKLKLADPTLFALIKSLFLDHQCSPEQIAGRLKLEQICQISYNTIYRAIYAGLFNPPKLSHGNKGAIRKLRHKGKPRHTKSYNEQ